MFCVWWQFTPHVILYIEDVDLNYLAEDGGKVSNVILYIEDVDLNTRRSNIVDAKYGHPLH